ncbi:MAG: hypothetical protein JHC93_07470 [Parachlamydiales bacterium]|nr:hypothetical protein [Parachlamydiales bacterium]
MGENNRDTIAIIFDFDDTLTPCSTSQFVEQHFQIPHQEFWKDWVAPLRTQGWDMHSSCLYTLIKNSLEANESRKIKKETFTHFGKALQFYPGVQELFDNLRKTLAEINPTIKIEFYLIGCGLREIIRHTSIAPHFTDIWACEFAYRNNGEIFFPKNIVSFTDKTRHLFQISKGITRDDSHANPFSVNKRIPRHKRPVPFDQMIYVADGFTDIPCFALVKERGGIAIGVFDNENPDKIAATKHLSDDERVTTLQVTDYRPTSELYRYLTLGIEAIASKITLKRHSYHDERYHSH